MTKPPNGKCDMCGTKKAHYWFGQTSVALCGDKVCSEKNLRLWEETCRQTEEEYELQRGWRQ